MVPKEKITVLPIYVDVSAGNAPSDMLRNKYPQFETIVLMVSRLEPEKNISLAIKAFAEAIKRHPKAGLVIVGSGSQEHVLKQLAHRYGVLDSVIFAGQ
ncbi:MAG: glycosyltransferase, partial [Patescibacteria group bacterium]|nr:glycosyltransferase [Patescibacteria group bacterium]